MFSELFSPRETLRSYRSKFFPLESRFFFPFRIDPIQEKFLSWKATRKSQNLLYSLKTAEERGTVSSYLNVFGCTTVLYRLFCELDSGIIYAGKGWKVNSFRKKMFRENRMRTKSSNSNIP